MTGLNFTTVAALLGFAFSLAIHVRLSADVTPVNISRLALTDFELESNSGIESLYLLPDALVPPQVSSFFVHDRNI